MLSLILKSQQPDQLISLLHQLQALPQAQVQGIISSREFPEEISLPHFSSVEEALVHFPTAIVLDMDNDPGWYPIPGVSIIRGRTAHLFVKWITEAVPAIAPAKSHPSYNDPENSEFLESQSPAMQEILDLAYRVAPTPTTVLIRGESGTGKEVIARLIHAHSPLSSKPLIIVNCTALSPQLFESELFGHRKGSFTGAVTDKVGLLEQAHRGTVFLDEIGDMPLEMQAKLLRFLQSGEIRPIGSTETRRVKVRILAATNRKLEQAIAAGQFREDLFYRLNAFTLHLPPLRQRKEDIPLLALHFLKLARARINKHVTRISPRAMEALVAYHWPGNLRELKNIIERAVVLATGDEITLNHLPFNFQIHVHIPADFSKREGNLIAQKNQLINRFEYEMITRLLNDHQGNVTRAAQAAGIPRRTFQRLMAKHGLHSHRYRQ